MLRNSARILVVVAVLGTASPAAADGDLVLGASWGDARYRAASSDPNRWLDNTRASKLLLGYNLADAPVSFELARIESGPLSRQQCPGGGVCAAVYSPPREFSAWQASAGYRLWTARRPASALYLKGSSLVLKGGVYDAESVIVAPPGEKFGNRGLVVGAVGTLMLTPLLGVRVEWEHLNDLKYQEDGRVNRYDASQALAGVIVQFGG